MARKICLRSIHFQSFYSSNTEFFIISKLFLPVLSKLLNFSLPFPYSPTGLTHHLVYSLKSPTRSLPRYFPRSLKKYLTCFNTNLLLSIILTLITFTKVSGEFLFYSFRSIPRSLFLNFLIISENWTNFWQIFDKLLRFRNQV